MEPATFFLFILVILMAGALLSGFPVAFALPGSAILTIALAAGAGQLFEGNPAAYFDPGTGGPFSWLSSGVTNFRAIYWEPDRDTLIAIPLFIFMGIMLQRSKIAEDLLVTMAQLFGPVPGGLGISVVIVGALLAATTGIVGATVVAMGLISLPIMLRNSYNLPLATGTICAAGTLGQIIPPSIVLIILADQLASAADVGQSLRQSAFSIANDTAPSAMPADLAVSTASAGDMFLGALIPGALIMVPIYIIYILVTALIRPSMAPPVRFEGADGSFIRAVLMSLVPPLLLIILVLGSILAGYATVNQAGAIGASGAILMAGYRLLGAARLRHFSPAILAVAAVLGIGVLQTSFDLNIRANDKAMADNLGLLMATGLVLTLVYSIVWSIWRIYRNEDILREVMIESAKTTSMVFLILLGAAMLTAAFRAFGGEHLVREFLTGLPGGFLTQFLVVMLVMFILGFFLDFIEIAVVVVPITAPILLADATANISAIWLGVMIGINIQTSFLTPPFGFALFYLRGVAPPEVRTTQIYRGVIVFIILQLVALGIVGRYERLANFMPRYATLLRSTAPPPSQPALQQCLEPLAFADADAREEQARAQAARLLALDLSLLPGDKVRKVTEAAEVVDASYLQIAALRSAEASNETVLNRAVQAAGRTWVYADLHTRVRRLERDIAREEAEIDELDDELSNLRRGDVQANASAIRLVEDNIAHHEEAITDLEAQIPTEWSGVLATSQAAQMEVDKARNGFRRLDNKYRALEDLLVDLDRGQTLAGVEGAILGLGDRIRAATAADAEAVRETLSAVKSDLSAIGGLSKVTSPFSKIDRELKKAPPDVEAALALYEEMVVIYKAEVAWRLAGNEALRSDLEAYLAEVQQGVAVRTLDAIPTQYRRDLAWCLSAHRDISLRF